MDLSTKQHCRGRGGKTVKSQRIREFIEKLCLLAMSIAIPIKSHQHDWPNVSWWKMKLVDEPKWTGVVCEASTLYKHLQTTKKCHKISTRLRHMGDSGVLCRLSSHLGEMLEIFVSTCLYICRYRWVTVCTHLCMCMNVCVHTLMLDNKINSPYLNKMFGCKVQYTLRESHQFCGKIVSAARHHSCLLHCSIT